MTWLSDTSHDVLAAVASGHTTAPEIRAATDMEPELIRQALIRLTNRQGLLHRVRRGRYECSPEGITYLATTMEDI